MNWKRRKPGQCRRLGRPSWQTCDARRGRNGGSLPVAQPSRAHDRSRPDVALRSDPVNRSEETAGFDGGEQHQLPFHQPSQLAGSRTGGARPGLFRPDGAGQWMRTRRNCWDVPINRALSGNQPRTQKPKGSANSVSRRYRDRGCMASERFRRVARGLRGGPGQRSVPVLASLPGNGL